MRLKKTNRSSKKPLFHRLILYFLGLMVLASLAIAFFLYRFIYAPNVDLKGRPTVELFIPTGADFNDVLDSIETKSFLTNTFSFTWLAEKKEYPILVKPGRYIVSDGMNNLQLVNMLRSGDQVPVRVTFNNIRTPEQLAQTISRQLEADSASISQLLNDPSFLERYGLNHYTALTIFIPNTYEFYWNSSAEQFIERMSREADRFWNEDRVSKALGIGLTKPEVIALASIVEKESNKNDEKPTIAGVYLNRLHRGWPLQADPTLVFASGDFTLTRVLNKHKKIDSPYNTYKNKGLPPGPICIPSIASIDAVLNYKKHEYMFFVANADMSGYHVFSKSLAEHNRNAKRYRQAAKESRKNP